VIRQPSPSIQGVQLAALLLGLGVDCLSMTPTGIPAVKYLVRAMTMTDAKALADEALEMTSAKEIYAECEVFFRARMKGD